MEGVFQAEPSNRHANLNYFKLQVSSLTLYGSDMPIFSQPVEIRVSIMDENREPIAPANSVSLAEELRMRHDPKVYLAKKADLWVGVKDNHLLCVQLANSTLFSELRTSCLKEKKVGENFFHSLNGGDGKSGIRVSLRGVA